MPIGIVIIMAAVSVLLFLWVAIERTINRTYREDLARERSQFRFVVGQRDELIKAIERFEAAVALARRGE
jgi:hypothetical protein